MSRYLNEVLGVNDDNLYNILCALDLIKDDQAKQNNFMCGWPEDAIRACNDLKEVLDFGEKDEKESVLSAIKQAKKIRDLKKPVVGVSSERRKKSTGKKKVM